MDQIAVRMNEDAKRFEAQIGQHLAVIEYLKGPHRIIFTHTEVPPELEGQGIGSQLAKYALDWAVDNNLKIQPMCPFVRAYVLRHKEYKPYVVG